MDWKRFNLLNNVFGWLSFVIAAIVYLLTIEPSASLWDCAEFIVAANKLEVGHPPGAPFFMLVYNLVSHFASDPIQIGWWTNALSAILSALTILFLFWTITLIMLRILLPAKRGEAHGEANGRSLSLSQAVVILGSGMVGALVYTFSDTFWYSAVEAEVYAFSSLFTAVVFWLMLKWEQRADNERSDRWLILIAYLMGLSIGVHLLNLLCIPAMALIYYYRRAKKPTVKGAFGALFASFALIVVMMYGVVQGLVKMAGRFDFFAVNSLGMSFNSGLYIYLALLILVLVWGMYETFLSSQGAKKHDLRSRIGFFLGVVLMGIPFIGSGIWLGIVLSIALAFVLYYFKKINMHLLHMMQSCLLVILVGYSSYGLILLRAGADTPMNQNAPSNAFSMRSYLAREQYGSVPLLYGPSFASQPIALKETTPVVGASPKSSPEDKDRYETLYTNTDYDYADGEKMLFPRIHSSQHIQAYNLWMNREPNDMSRPSFADNISFFLKYQVNYMYWRYFLWNFAGRQNDIQGDGGLLRGNAITGIPIVDKLLIGPSDEMPDMLAKNKGRNVYFLLPLLLGLIGIAYQLIKGDRGVQNFWIIFFLFFMTGLAIVLYVNQTPNQPRERDYSYAGSFYAFSIWVGIGVAGLAALLQRVKLKEELSAMLAAGLALLIPIQMASQNWDDHDRSGRSVASAFGNNYLESCEPNAIIFTYGDNDTFPLWYAQEVEGVRPDIRVCNQGYLGADWYIRSMQRQAYESAPLDLEYMNDAFIRKNIFVRIEPNLAFQAASQAGLDASSIASLPDGSLAMGIQDALRIATLPVKYGEGVMPIERLVVPLDSAVIQRVYGKPLLGETPRFWDISIADKRLLSLADLATLNLIANINNGRPIYWAITSPANVFNGIQNYFTQTGMANRLSPIPNSQMGGHIDVERMYTNVMEKFRWGGLENPKVYLDENIRNAAQTYRSAIFAPLADALMEKGDTVRARKVLERCLEVISPEAAPYDRSSLNLAQSLYLAGMQAEADAVLEAVARSSMRSLNWFFRLSQGRLAQLWVDGEVDMEMTTAITAVTLSMRHNSKVIEDIVPKLEGYRRILYGNESEAAQPQPQAEPKAEAEPSPVVD